jgi:hypothetical protein
MSDAEYLNALADLFPAQHPTLPALPRDTVVAGFENDAAVQEPSDVRIARYEEISRLYAAGYDSTTFPGIDALGARLFRRPLTPDESARFDAAFERWSVEHGAELAVRLTVAAMLQAPQFLYRVEGDPLTPYQVAARLASFLWESVPDDALLAEAGGRLDVRSQAGRMLDDPRASRVRWSFQRQWLGLDRVLTEEHAFIDRQAALADTEAFVEQSASLTESLGVLTRVAFLAGTSHPGATSPPIRGNVIQSRLLCLPPVSPPPGADLSPPTDAEGNTNRERFEARTRGASCQGCHLSLNGIGFGFEHWAFDGTWQQLDHGEPVDAQGVLIGTDVDGPFDGTTELLEKLSASSDVRRCASQRWLQYALGRSVVDGEAPLVERLALEHQTRALLLELVASPSFTRQAEVTP